MHSLYSTSRCIRRSILPVALVLLFVFLILNAPPRSFPLGSTLRIENGSTLLSISTLLKERQVIKSPFLFRTYVILFGGEKALVQGDYVFSEKITGFGVAERIMDGQLGIVPLRITIPEGSTTREIAGLFNTKFKNFDDKKFLDLAKGKEGYLFPDTYLFFPADEPAVMVKKMERTFTEKTASLQKEVLPKGYSWSDVVTMASILEAEGRTLQTRRMIAGVLWKRLSIGMPLQVDVAIQYIKNKATPDLTLEDLKIPSPYNLYLNKGLPPGPINNPGLEAIKAALSPIPSKYLYFLVDKQGVMHYAVTHDEHVVNKNKYLR